MRVIEPIKIDLISSTVPDSSADVWDGDTAYTAGTRVLVTHSKDGTDTIVQTEYVARRDNTGAYPPDNVTERDAARTTVSDTDDASDFEIGEIISTASASGRVAQISGTTGGYLIVQDMTGDFAMDDTLTGATSGATATVKSSVPSSLAPPWERVGASNRWAMFDAHVSTQTAASDEIDVTVGFGRCDSLVLLDVEAAEVRIDVTNISTGEMVMSEVYDMCLDESAAWSDYFFSEAKWRTTLSVSTPLYHNAQARIRIIAREGYQAKCGHVACGRAQYLGPAQWAPRVGLLDYSQKSTDDTGTTTLTPGPWAKELSVDMLVPTASVGVLQRNLAGYRGRACVWDCNNETDFEPLSIFGFFNDFSLILSGPTSSACSISIQGLT
jgi:hypothetical protein